MPIHRIAAILAVIVQVLNGTLGLGAGLLPIKITAIISVVVGIIQAILPRVQGSSATAAGQ